MVKGKEIEMTKAFWKGHEIYWVNQYREQFVQILFYCDDFESPITGTGACWALTDDITVEVSHD